MARRDLPFPCAVVRHRGARRMSLRVSRAGVRLTVPPGARAAEMDAFLRASAGWVARQQDRLGPPPPPLADGDRLALLDEELRLAVAPARRASVRREGTRLVAAVPAGADLDAAVERWYRREAAEALGARSRALAAALGVRVAAVAIRDPRSRWGSCAAASERLSYSWRLLLAPEAVAGYVVAHEVCHLVVPDHSPGYWELVARVAPGAGEARGWLRRHGERLHLGPAWRAISPA